MPQAPIGAIIERLRSNNAQEAWTDFLAAYSDRIYKVANITAGNPELAADCYLFACEQLSRRRFHRLLQFRIGGPASFETWLSVVVRHLCFDCLRAQFGRKRAFRSIARLSPLDNAVFECRSERGFSLDETLEQLRPEFPGLTVHEVLEADGRIAAALTPRQRWMLGTRAAASAASSVKLEEASPLEVADPRDTQDMEFLRHEQRSRLARALARLQPDERYLVCLRFEQELSFAEVARAAGLGDAQRAHHRLGIILEKLRKHLQAR